MKKVFVCASTRLAKNENINKQCKLLGEILAEKDMCYVHDSSIRGLKGIVLKNFAQKSKNFICLISDNYLEYGVPAIKSFVEVSKVRVKKISCEEEYFENITYCDHIIVMPGGINTLEELLYSNEAVQTGEDQCNIVLVNIDGFYDHFLAQLEVAKKENLANFTSFHFSVVKDVRDVNFISEYESER